MRLRKETELNNGDATVPENGANGHRSVAASVADYLEETTLTKKPKTLAAYSTALAYFTESCHKLNLEDIDRKDLLKFCAFLRDEKEQAPRSVYNKFENLMSFLAAALSPVCEVRNVLRRMRYIHARKLVPTWNDENPFRALA